MYILVHACMHLPVAVPSVIVTSTSTSCDVTLLIVIVTDNEPFSSYTTYSDCSNDITGSTTYNVDKIHKECKYYCISLRPLIKLFKIKIQNVVNSM